MHEPPTPFRPEAGITGFHGPRDPAPAVTDAATCRTALYAAARDAAGRVEGFTAQAYPRTFHSATVRVHDAAHIVLFHVHQPLVAFAADQLDWYADEFVDPPKWSDTLARHGFTILTAPQLCAPFTEADASALSAAERAQVAYWHPKTVGAVLFNSWD
ncbi:hypothetical protein [Yinghuangia soli]|uniref:Uncharacterized protein n=1 Tax=Yinghuangia soli TaxID=2908204 RepID=A0AA41Q4Y5_9ACTN|nr:hypothetical protein [Yinghuangia soli]MCF2531655.1 hypothetical protein [Yinghuangia soli]